MKKIYEWVGKALNILGMYICFMSSPLSGQRTNWVMIFVGFLVFVIGLVFQTISNIIGQVKINNNGKDLVDRILAGQLEPYALYLRAFDLDGVFKINKEHQNLFDLDSGFDRIGTDILERVLGDCVNPVLPLIGFGGDGIRFSSVGEVGFVEEWKRKITTLIEHSTIVFVIPAPNEGTLYEIGIIKNYLDKTVFIQPSSYFDYEGPHGTFENYWLLASKKVKATHTLNLPEYKKIGTVFRYNENGDVIVQTADQTNIEALSKSIKDLFDVQASPHDPPEIFSERAKINPNGLKQVAIIVLVFAIIGWLISVLNI